MEDAGPRTHLYRDVLSANPLPFCASSNLALELNIASRINQTGQSLNRSSGPSLSVAIRSSHHHMDNDHHKDGGNENPKRNPQRYIFRPRVNGFLDIGGFHASPHMAFSTFLSGIFRFLKAA